MNKLPYFFSLIVLLSTFAGTRSAEAQILKKWSPQAKGAAIGGLGGAAAGAVINKRNRAVGGVVGGVAGGAIGYGVGKHIDNKQKERARIAAANRAAANRAAAAREAEYRRAIARNNASRTTTTTTRTALAPANSLVASSAAMPGTMAAPATANANYLPNTSYGDPSKPYSTEEYRRKSW